MKLPQPLERIARLPTRRSGQTSDVLPSRDVALLLVPVALLATAVVVQRRRGTAATGALPGANGPVAGQIKARQKPRRIIRYYALGLLINALEHESTRKAVVVALKAARKHA